MTRPRLAARPSRCRQHSRPARRDDDVTQGHLRPGILGGASVNVAQQPRGEGPLTYHHDRYGQGKHWLSAQEDGDEIGYAYAIERAGPGGPHVEIVKLWANPYERGRGIGSGLLDLAGEVFAGQELRLKPYPSGEDGNPSGSELREYYGNRGFTDYQLKDGDPFELSDYMTRCACPGPDSGPPGRQVDVAFPRPPACRPFPCLAGGSTSRAGLYIAYPARGRRR